MHLRENLKRFRILNGLTQQQVADLLGIERTAYASYELGRTGMSISNLCKLAKYFGVSLDEMVYSEPGVSTNYQPSVASDNCPMLFRGECRDIGYITRDERYFIMLYRASDKKEEVLRFLGKTLEK